MEGSLTRPTKPRPAHPLPWLLAAVLALVVVILGAYTRLSDAGLGCPDWPGCYGHVGVPASPAALDRANEAFAQRPVEPAKAWKEMVHRYAAGLLGLVVLGLTVSAWRRAAGRALATALLVLIVFQAALGMWTVTLLLKPVVVMGHLLGGFAVLSLLWLGYLGARSFVPSPPPAACAAASAGGRWASWCWWFRSPLAAGPAPTTPPWPARLSRSAWASGGRRWT